MIPILSSRFAGRRAVPAATYRSIVLGDSPVHYWPMDEDTSATTLAALAGATAITLGTLTAKPIMGAAGQVDGTAAQFDGTNDFATVALNLSAYSAIVVEFFLYWDAFAANDDFAMEFTPNHNSNAGNFMCNPNESGLSKFRFIFGIGDGATYNSSEFIRPSAAAWHHYSCRFDKGAAAATQVVPYLDGAAVAYSKNSSGTITGVFANSTLNLMCRNAASLFGAGRMQHLAIYNTLSAARILAHAQAAGLA